MLTNSDDITECFADKYRELYTSVSYDSAYMQVIRDELNKSLQDCETESSLAVRIIDDVMLAIVQLKPDKCDGNFFYCILITF